MTAMRADFPTPAVCRAENLMRVSAWPKKRREDEIAILCADPSPALIEMQKAIDEAREKIHRMWWPR
jgi:hypothetical protein